MTYEETPVQKTANKQATSKAVNGMLDKFSTWHIMWHLVKRHKFGLLVSYALIISVLYFMPFAPSLVISLVSGK